MPSTLRIFNKWLGYYRQPHHQRTVFSLCPPLTLWNNQVCGWLINESSLPSSITTQGAELLSSFQTSRNKLLPSQGLRSEHWGSPGGVVGIHDAAPSSGRTRLLNSGVQGGRWTGTRQNQGNFHAIWIQSSWNTDSKKGNKITRQRTQKCTLRHLHLQYPFRASFSKSMLKTTEQDKRRGRSYGGGFLLIWERNVLKLTVLMVA